MKSNQEILELEKALLKLENLHASFDYLRITIASPKRIKSWGERILPNGSSIGEVLRPETINFRSHQPEINGLFCERIFGPIKNWKCKCGKYNGFILNKICEECEVEIIEARVRRYRMGYIELTCPVTHLWYLKGVPNYLAILLKAFDPNLEVSKIEEYAYFKDSNDDDINPLSRFVDAYENDNELNIFYLKKDYKNRINLNLPQESTAYRSNLKSENDFLDNHYENNSVDDINSKLKLLKKSKNRLKSKKLVGAEVIKAALESLNIKEEIQLARSLVDSLTLRGMNTSLIPDKALIRRIRILESFLSTRINPSWMVLTILPVLPPNLRPLLELENGRLVAADVNEIYRLIITRNQRLFDFMYNYIAPNLITIHGRKLLQESVDSLIDNSRLPKEKTFCLNNKPLRSLTEILEGKQGRFRQSLLGKRVDYSGRSVIIVGPTLRLNQCGLPYEMCVELFQPFLINELLKTKIKAPSHNTKLAHVIIKKNKPFIWSLLEGLTKKHCIILNRAPTLHRFGIQAFDPLLVLGQAIHLHPLVCTGFNADFDGDQMAVHLPLYEASQLEARTLMRPSYNLLSPSNGEVILKPTQDMVIGCYYLTLMIKKAGFTNSQRVWFSNKEKAILCFYQKKITLHTPILVRYKLEEFEIIVRKNRLFFVSKCINLPISETEIVIHKYFSIGETHKKMFLVTNLGILITYVHGNIKRLEENMSLDQILNKSKITDFFLETTAGRLIFNLNFKNAINKNYDYYENYN